jgi:DNA-binding HxlR family transcriptional regulator
VAARVNEFKQILGSVPPRTLGQRLSELEEAGCWSELWSTPGRPASSTA